MEGRTSPADAGRRAEEMIERLGDAQCVLDHDFRIVAVNAATERVLGRSRETLLGRSHWEVFPASFDAPVGRAFRRVVAEGIEQHFSHHYTGAGYDLHLEVDAYPTDEGGLSMFWRDITDRVRAETALRESEAKWRGFFDATNVALVILEFDFDEGGRPVDFRHIDVNPALEGISGFKPEQILGRSVTEMAPPEEAVEWMEFYAEVLTSGVPSSIERFSPTMQRWVKVNAAPFGSRQVAAVFENTTNRKMAERVLRESEERQAFLLQLSDRLRVESDPRTIGSIAMRRLADHLNLDRAYVARVDKARDLAEIGPEYRRDGLEAAEGVLTLSDFPEAWRRVEAATLVLTDTAGDPTLTESDKAGFAAFRMGALIIASARKGTDNPVWSVLVATKGPRQWTPGEVALVEETAERTWAAIERAHAEGALRESEANYRSLFESVGQGYCDLELVRDGEGRVVDLRYLKFNPEFERIFGISVAQAEGRMASEVFPDLERWWIDRYERVARAGAPERIENEVASLGRWFEAYAYPRGGDRLSVLFEDITARKRGEIALRDSEARQAFLLTLSDALRAESGVDAVGCRAVEMLAVQLGADRVYLVTVNSDDDRLVVTHETRRADLPPLLGEYRSSMFPRAIREIFERTAVYEDVRTDPRLTDLDRASFTGLNAVGFMGASIRKGTQAMIWGAGAVSTKPRSWTATETTFFEEAIERTWAAIERARAETALQQAHDFLEQRVRERTSQVQSLFERLVSSQEEERRRIARDIHDQVGQQMTALRMNLEALRSQADGQTSLAEQAERTQRLAEELDQSIDFLTWQLRPAALDDLGLSAALQNLVTGWAERFEIAADFAVDGVEDVRLPRDVEANLYRIAQEALHNVAKHAQATQVTAYLTQQGNELVLLVEDNGRGFDAAIRSKDGHMGLMNMRERAALVGGRLDIESGAGHGTSIHVRIPERNGTNDGR
jgi:PAS domain S-box-containing protein